MGNFAMTWHQDSRSTTNPGPSRKDLRRKWANYCRKSVKVNMDAGHGGASGRYDAFKETAFLFAFILDQVGLAK